MCFKNIKRLRKKYIQTFSGPTPLYGGDEGKIGVEKTTVCCVIIPKGSHLFLQTVDRRINPILQLRKPRLTVKAKDLADSFVIAASSQGLFLLTCF